MIILKPTDLAQPIFFRCVEHEETSLLVSINTAFGTTLTVTSCDYIDGAINGNIVLPFASIGEATKKDIRFFSCDASSQSIIDIASDPQKEYSMTEWGDLLSELDTEGAIEKEIFRGSFLVTSQTNLDKFKLYGN